MSKPQFLHLTVYSNRANNTWTKEMQKAACLQQQKCGKGRASTKIGETVSGEERGRQSSIH